MRFQSLKEWIELNEGGSAIPDSRPLTWEEAQKTYSWIQKNVAPELGLSIDEMDVIGSYGKKREGETHGDLDIAVSAKALSQKSGTSDILNFVNDILAGMGFQTKVMPGFKQVSAGIPIPGTSDIAQVDFMLSPDLDWSRFVYHSPNFRTEESKYKGVYRNALLMAIITETDKNILKRTPEGDVEELETNVIRYPEGIWRARKSFMGKKGLVKTGQLLKDFDKFVTTNPQEVADLAVGGGYKPEDINTFEKLWNIINSDNYIHKNKMEDILEKFEGNLKSIGISYPKEAIEKYPDIFSEGVVSESRNFIRGADPMDSIGLGDIIGRKHKKLIAKLDKIAKILKFERVQPSKEDVEEGPIILAKWERREGEIVLLYVDEGLGDDPWINYAAEWTTGSSGNDGADEWLDPERWETEFEEAGPEFDNDEN
jgi:hypothetical protein